MKRLFETVKMDYLAYKELYGLYDFTDLPQYLLDKLNDYDETIENIEALFVDEFQDVDDIQIELFDRVPAIKKFYIGDPQQSIYIFRGATPDILKRLDDFKQHNLVINYRSYQEIIDFASFVQMRAMEQETNFATEKESMRSRIECIKGYGGEVYSLNASGLAFKINEYIKRDGLKVVKEFVDRNSMILCRKNRQVKAIKELGYPNVSTVHQAKGLEYPSVVVTNFEIGPQEPEEVNIAYVAMTRAENQLLVADYEAFIFLLEKLIPEYRKAHSLF
jgi:superfamily I DNA/RNA helicase